MKPLAMLGVLLIVVGGILLAFQGISYTRRKDVVRAGPLEVTAEQKETIPPYVGGIAVVAGVVVLAMARKK